MHMNQMDEKWRRICGLVRVSDTFLFGLLPGGQSTMYQWLNKEKGFCDEYGRQYRGAYSSVLDDMLLNQRIERVVREIIIPLAKDEFDIPLANGKSNLEVLKEYWDKGEPRSGPIVNSPKHEDWRAYAQLIRSPSEAREVTIIVQNKKLPAVVCFDDMILARLSIP